MSSRKRQKKSKASLFDPDKISADLYQSICCDLQPLLHEKPGVDSIMAQATRYQVDTFLKKYLPTTYDSKGQEERTFENFESTNSSILDANVKLLLKLPKADTRIQSNTPFMDKVHLRARALMHFVLGSFCEDEWFLECKHSSGSSLGVPFSDTSLERKFTSPVTVTSNAEPYWKRYLEYDRRLYSILTSSGYVLGALSSVQGSRATTVDKTADKRRMICVEPTANMFLQQGLMHVMYRRMKAVGLDVMSLQTRHKELAYEASITGYNATIDFSSASDCVSIELLRWLLPPNWFDVVDAVRCRYTLLGNKWVELQMIATMGNATTFPLETLVFWTYAHAVRLSLKHGNSLFPEWEDLREVSVYGDDCIVPSKQAPDFMRVCEDVGFKVNLDKSYFGSERFRESCGGDYLVGRNVRPFNLRPPVSRRMSSLEPWLYTAWNALIKKYISYFGELTYVYDKALWATFFRLFSEHNLSIKFVPPDYPDDAGLKWSFDYARISRLYRFRSEPVYQDKHGTRTFKYLRFVYRLKYRRSDILRLWESLKRGYSYDTHRLLVANLPYESNLFPEGATAQDMFNPKRVIGGYVVASGLSGHWSDELEI
jgi:hypothetical protein